MINTGRAGDDPRGPTQYGQSWPIDPTTSAFVLLGAKPILRGDRLSEIFTVAAALSSYTLFLHSPDSVY